MGGPKASIQMIFRDACQSTPLPSITANNSAWNTDCVGMTAFTDGFWM